MKPSETRCSYCLAGVPVETVAERPACERCAKDLRDLGIAEVLEAAEVQTPADAEAA